MSAFFVTAAVIADSVACLKEAKLIPASMNALAMGQALQVLNAQALEARYGDPYSTYKAEIDAYNNPPAHPDLAQRLMSLQCLIYQCSEGDVPNNAVFKSLEKAEEILVAKLGNNPAANFTNHSNTIWNRATDIVIESIIKNSK